MRAKSSPRVEPRLAQPDLTPGPPVCENAYIRESDPRPGDGEAHMLASCIHCPPRLLVAAAVALALAAPANFAPAAEDATLDEVVVTAERREQNLQDVPISATVFSARGPGPPRRHRPERHPDRSRPSVAINVVNRSTFVNIRGVGIAQSAPTSNPGVAFYIDGQLIPHEQFIGQSFYDIALDRSAARTAGHADRPELHRRRDLCAHAGAGVQQVLRQLRADLRQLQLGPHRSAPRTWASPTTSRCACRACTTSATASPTTSAPAAASPATWA